jgi:penicillin amidase
MRWLKIAAIVLVILVVGLTAAWNIFFRLPIPDYSGTFTVPGLTAEVVVKTDDFGIPHIFAQNEPDMFFAQGYITARERLFQMELTRLAGRGELSTLFGQQTIEQDKFLKTVGFNRLAKAEYAAASDELKTAVDSYVAGVNAWIDDMQHIPREFVVLGAKPHKWEPQDTMAAGLLMAYGLTRSKKSDLILYQVGQVLDPDLRDLFIPSYPDFAPRVSDAPKPHKAVAGLNFQNFPNSKTDPLAVFEPFSLGFPASNWMIFHGSRTTTGKPIFTGSPDLEPKLPALFHVVHIKGGRFDVVGGALPGTPGICVLGYNGKIAWSTVNGRVDELDYFVEKINPDNSDQYLTENGWQDFEILEDTITIREKDGVNYEKLVILISRHGPIISKVLPLAPDNCAMQWVGNEPTGVFEGFLRICTAANFNEFKKAAGYIRSPTLNLGYADADGHIGYQYVARPPIRKTPGGALPVDGWTGEHDWTGYIPFEDLPYDLDPDKGYFGSFNNEAKPTPYHMTNYYLFERAMRFDQIMQKTDKVSLESATAMQLDTISMVPQRWVPLIFKAMEGRSELDRYTALFKDWDYSMDFESRAAALFNAFYYNLMGNGFADEIGDKLWTEHMAHPYISYITDLTLIRIMDDPQHVLWDDQSTKDVTETRDDIIVKSLQQAVADLSERYGDNPDDWKWGDVHQMTFKHPLGEKLKFLNLAPIPTQGDGTTINAGMWDNLNPYAFKSGGVIRMIVDFSDPEKSTIISPPGQSGHYKSPYYGDQAEPWAQGRQIPMRFHTADNLDQVMTLKPGP